MWNDWPSSALLTQRLVTALLTIWVASCAHTPTPLESGYDVDRYGFDRHAMSDLSVGNTLYPSSLCTPQRFSSRCPPTVGSLQQAGQSWDLWQRVRAKLMFTDIYNPRIDQYIDQYSNQPSYLYSLSQRAEPFMHYIVEAADRRGLPMELALVPMVESGFKPTAVSPKSAAGLWQIMPGTGRRFGLTQDQWYDGRTDLSDATQAALDYLEYLYDFFEGDWLLALAAYNAGEGTVQRAMRANAQRGKATDYWNLDLPHETEQYVPKILALSHLIAYSDAYQLDLHNISDEPYLLRIDVGPQLDLSLAANAAGMSLSELRHLNPAFKKGVTPDRHQHLMLPRDKALALQSRLPNLERDTFRRPPTLATQSTSPVASTPPSPPTTAATPPPVTAPTFNSQRLLAAAVMERRQENPPASKSTKSAVKAKGSTHSRNRDSNQQVAKSDRNPPTPNRPDKSSAAQVATTPSAKPTKPAPVAKAEESMVRTITLPRTQQTRSLATVTQRSPALATGPKRPSPSIAERRPTVTRATLATSTKSQRDKAANKATERLQPPPASSAAPNLSVKHRLPPPSSKSAVRSGQRVTRQ